MLAALDAAGDTACSGPDLGLGPEKVRREIQLQARLSHVNIVELKQVRAAGVAAAVATAHGSGWQWVAVGGSRGSSNSMPSLLWDAHSRVARHLLQKAVWKVSGKQQRQVPIVTST
jgi:hypothetical protein